MQNFVYYTPTKVVFGKDTVAQLPALLREFGAHKVLVHYGKGSVIRSGLLARIKGLLDEAGIAYVELGGVVPNPRLSLVYKGIDLAKREGVDLILAVGGGSVIDSSKAIGYGVVNEGDVWDFYAHTRQATGCLPVGVVLTLAATGSEMSNSSVITKKEGWLKRGYNTDYCRPKFAVMDPTYTETLPPYQTACGCTDIMMHTMERYFARDGSMELTDAIAEGLLRTVMENARILLTDPKNYEARAEIMWAGSLSHNGLTGCGSDGGDWVCHRMEHEMGGLWDIAHGAGLSAIWGSWARFTYMENLDRFYRFATHVMDVEPNPAARDVVAMEGIGAVENFFREIGMPTSFHDLNLAPTDEEIKTLAKKYVDAVGGSAGSAVKIGGAEAETIYRMAL
jgi:alcohol dehydrogenase YqhD (iron-dependent ADH family)